MTDAERNLRALPVAIGARKNYNRLVECGFLLAFYIYITPMFQILPRKTSGAWKNVAFFTPAAIISETVEAMRYNRITHSSRADSSYSIFLASS